MNPTRRGLLGGAALTAAATMPILRPRAQGSRPVIRIGVMNDQSGTYRDVTGPTSVACTRQAVQEFGDKGFDVEVLVADHLNKPDLAASLAKQWIDSSGVDVIQDGGASSCALVLAGICRDKDRIFLSTSTATSALTGAACTPNTIHWVFDTYMLAKSTGGAMVRAGGDTWFFITANYAFGLQLQKDTESFINAAGGKVLANRPYPFPETTDFSALLVQAQSSGAKVLGLANAGADTINAVKQAHEFGVPKTMKIATLLMYSTDVHALGLEVAQGLLLSESFYWDLNDRTRAFTARVKPRVPNQVPNMSQAGQYSSALHYLKVVAAMGPAEAKASGAATVARMKATPTDDDCFGAGSIRADGRKLHPSYLFEVKKPSESRSEWDLMKLIATTPADQAFRPIDQGGCPLVKA